MDILDDQPGPRRGDCVMSIGRKGVGTIYQVLTSRKVQRRDPAAVPRFTMMVRVVSEVPSRGRIFEFSWYPRKRKTRTMDEYVRGRRVLPS